jgi:tetratricopeptide (TPR) repeat protein
MEQRKYPEAEEKIRACLLVDKNYLPALSVLSELEYRKLNYKEAFDAASKALSINTYDAAANYYFGLAALKLNKPFDAKDGFDIASQSAEYRVAAFNRLRNLFKRTAIR